MSDARTSPASVEARRFDKELSIRIVFGTLLAVVAIGATFIGGYVFAAFVALGTSVAIREWYRMVGNPDFGREAVVAALAIIAALAITVFSSNVAMPLGLLALGAVLAAGLSAVDRAPPILGGLGTLYIGIPAYSLVALRMHTQDAQWTVLGVFLTVWTADTGALFVGKWIGGPKLSPLLSPNKTWAGLAGGLVLPALAAGAYVTAFGGNLWRGLLLGLLFALAGHAGDLFESWVKRRVGRKNSGGLIPGHGGMLDRIDSTLFVAPLAALLFHFFGAAQLVGVGP